MAVSAMKLLHPEIIGAIQSKALFSKMEEELLGKVGHVGGLVFLRIELFVVV